MKKNGKIPYAQVSLPYEDEKTNKNYMVKITYMGGIPQGFGGIYEPTGSQKIDKKNGDRIVEYELKSYLSFDRGELVNRNLWGGAECLAIGIIGNYFKDPAISAVVSEVVSSILFGNGIDKEAISESYFLNKLKAELKKEGYHKEANALTYGEFFKCLFNVYMKK